MILPQRTNAKEITNVYIQDNNRRICGLYEFHLCGLCVKCILSAHAYLCYPIYSTIVNLKSKIIRMPQRRKDTMVH